VPSFRLIKPKLLKEKGVLITAYNTTHTSRTKYIAKAQLDEVYDLRAYISKSSTKQRRYNCSA
jgi:DNA-directed RNA polymerase subunit L